MQKAGRLQRLSLALAGLLLILVFVTYGAGQLVAWVAPSAQAAGSHIDSNGSECTNSGHGPSFGGTIIISPNEVSCGGLTSFGGVVEIKGEIRGKVTAFTSNLMVAGVVNGDITLYAGTITLLNGSQVHGNIHLYGGREFTEKGAQLDGTIIDHTRHVWLFDGIGEFSFPFWSILTWVVLGIVLIKLLPEHVMFVRTTAVNKMRRSVIVGLLSILLAPAVLVVLIALIIPIPLAIIIVLILIAAWALGTVAVGWTIGDHIMRALAPNHNTRLKQVVVGLVVLALLGSLPYVGWIINIGVGLLGLGAVFLSRFGTRLYSQPKQPLTL
jgi:hypothetical protein